MATRKLRFRVKIMGKEAGVVSAIIPPIDIPETFGTRGRVPVKGTVNGLAFRSSLMPMSGCHMMPVNKALCQESGTKPDDVVDVGPRTEEKQAARDRWKKLSFTHKKEMATSISGAKQEETKKRRLVKVMQVLKTAAKWTG